MKRILVSWYLLNFYYFFFLSVTGDYLARLTLVERLNEIILIENMS